MAKKKLGEMMSEEEFMAYRRQAKKKAQKLRKEGAKQRKKK